MGDSASESNVFPDFVLFDEALSIDFGADARLQADAFVLWRLRGESQQRIFLSHPDRGAALHWTVISTKS